MTSIFIRLERPESRNTGSHYSLSDTIANTASSTEVTLLSTNQGKPRNSFSSPLDSYKPQYDAVGGSVSPDGAAMTMLSIPGASGWCGEEALKELSLLYREREELQEQQGSIMERLEQAQSKAVDLKDVSKVFSCHLGCCTVAIETGRVHHNRQPT